MDFTGDSQPTANEPFEVWRKVGGGEEYVSRHMTLHRAQRQCVGRQGYFVRCRPWPQAKVELPGIWSNWFTPVSLLAIGAASLVAGWLIVHGGLR